MKIAIFPESSTILVNLVQKNGHETITIQDLQKQKRKSSDPDDYEFDESSPPFNMTDQNPIDGLKYAAIEVPSGVRGRMSLLGPIIDEADAAILLNGAPLHYKNDMYDKLNDLILFACDSCANTTKLVRVLIRQRNIPFLDLDYPTTRESIIDMIGEINNFLSNLDKKESVKKESDVTYLTENSTHVTYDLPSRISLEELTDVIKEVEKDKNSS